MKRFVSAKLEKLTNDVLRLIFFTNDQGKKKIKDMTPKISAYAYAWNNYISWRDSAHLTARFLAERIKSQQVYALFPSEHIGLIQEKVDFALLRLSQLRSQPGCGLHYSITRDNFSRFSGFDNCFQRIILNSV